MDYRVYDDFAKGFTDLEAFLDELKSQEKESEWFSEVESNKIKISAIKELPICAEIEAKRLGTTNEAVLDTMSNTGLTITFNGKEYLLRDSAMKSLLETAKVTGGIICKMKPEHLEDLFNLCLPLTTGSSLILFRDEKISAVLSDEKGGYKYFPMTELVNITEEALNEKFDSFKFDSGNLYHDYMSAVWVIDEPKLLEDYYKKLKSGSVADTNFVPIVRINSSDVGTSSVTVVPMFRTTRGINIRICEEMKIPHKKGKDIKEYAEKCKEVFAKFQEISIKLAEMSDIDLTHPCNAFILACKKAGLPKKLSYQALEDFQMYVGTDSSTAHDVYLGICEVLFYAKAKYSDKDICRLEELVSRCLFFNWEELDIPGTHTW